MKEVHVARCALLSYNRRKLLLLRRAEHNKTGQGQWECPGGKSPDEKSLYDTLVMEVSDETALPGVIINKQFVEVDRSEVVEGPYAGATFVTYFTDAHDDSGRGDRVCLEDEHDACVWTTYEEALDYDLTPQTRKGLIAIAARLKAPM